MPRKKQQQVVAVFEPVRGAKLPIDEGELIEKNAEFYLVRATVKVGKGRGQKLEQRTYRLRVERVESYYTKPVDPDAAPEPVAPKATTTRRKPAAKKAAPKKAAAKPKAKKAAAKKPAAKKAAAKKPAAKKAAPKKSEAKKPAVKKPAAGRAAALFDADF